MHRFKSFKLTRVSTSINSLLNVKSAFFVSDGWFNRDLWQEQSIDHKLDSIKAVSQSVSYISFTLLHFSIVFFFFLSTTRSSWSNIVFPSPCCPKGFYLGLSSINHITEAVARVTSGHSKTFKPLKKLLGHSSIVWHSVIAWHHYIFGGQQHSTFKNWIKNWKKTGTFTPYTLFILLVGNKDN